MFNRVGRAKQDSEELNVVPVMNLFMVLIPFLLMGAAFFHIGVIPVSTPTHDPQQSDLPKTPTTVAVNLVIKPGEMSLTASSVSLSPEELEALGGVFSSKEGRFDVDGLQQHLESIKTQYPDSNTIIVVPHNEVIYQDLVEILDATRERMDGVDEKGEVKYKELFPVTVFSRFIPPSSEPEAEPASEESEGFDFDMEGVE